MYKIEEPLYFYFFTIIPILIVIFLLVLWWKKRTQKQFANAALLEKLAPNSSTFKATLKLIFLLIGISFLIISLVNPKMGTKLQTVKREGVDVVFALDVSRSMLAEDIAPNRLEKAKQIISKIIDNLGSDRVGVIIYAGNSYPLLPITTDHAAANMFLQNANPDLVSSQGTAINEALELSKTYYNNDEQTNRFLVIISDGEDHQEETRQVAQNLSNEGVKVYTVGVGTEKGGFFLAARAGGRNATPAPAPRVTSRAATFVIRLLFIRRPPSEHPAQFNAIGIELRVGAATAVDEGALPAAAHEHAALEFVAQAGADVPGEVRFAVGGVEVAADVAPPGIPPAAGRGRTVGDV